MIFYLFFNIFLIEFWEEEDLMNRRLKFLVLLLLLFALDRLEK